MMNTKFRRILSLVTVIALMATFSVTALAGGGPEYPVRENETENSYPERDTSDTNTVVIPTVTAPLTPSGNLTLVDDIQQTTTTSSTETKSDDQKAETTEPENKQFITVQSKNGNYFYLIIDRSGESENVYFLNMVDEADLLALIEEDTTEELPACICSDKCVIGSIKSTCEICAYNISDCAGVEPEPVEPENPEEPEEPVEEPTEEPSEPSADSNNSAILLVVLLAIFGVGGFLIYKKIIQPKNHAKQHPDPDVFDYEDENEEDEEEL